MMEQVNEDVYDSGERGAEQLMESEANRPGENSRSRSLRPSLIGYGSNQARPRLLPHHEVSKIIRTLSSK